MRAFTSRFAKPHEGDHAHRLPARSARDSPNFLQQLAHTAIDIRGWGIERHLQRLVQAPSRPPAQT